MMLEFCKNRARQLYIPPAIPDVHLYFPIGTVSLGTKTLPLEILALIPQHDGNSLHTLVTPLPACGPSPVPSFINSVMMSNADASSRYGLRCSLWTQPLPKGWKVFSFPAAA